MTAAHHLTAVLAVGVARLSRSNRIAADPPNAASIVAIERRPPNVDPRHSIACDGQAEEHAGGRVPRPNATAFGGRSNRLVLVPWVSEGALLIALLLTSSSVMMVARPSNSIQEAARLFNRAISLMNVTSGPVSMVVGPSLGSSVGGGCHRLVPAP